MYEEGGDKNLEQDQEGEIIKMQKNEDSDEEECNEDDGAEDKK